ncbi:hypothetical protein PENTCL1PPCAC_15518, partial [Pristionchus entomophagus]
HHHWVLASHLRSEHIQIETILRRRLRGVESTCTARLVAQLADLLIVLAHWPWKLQTKFADWGLREGNSKENISRPKEERTSVRTLIYMEPSHNSFRCLNGCSEVMTSNIGDWEEEGGKSGKHG